MNVAPLAKTTALRSLRWKSFSLRALFVLMTVCCVVLEIWSAYVNPYRRQAQSLAEVQRLQGASTIDPAEGPAWQRWLIMTMLGEKAIVRVVKVDLTRRKVTDDDLTSIAGLTFLRELKLDYTNVTDDGIAALDSLRKLTDLSLRYTALSDHGLKSLGDLPHLQKLTATGTQITDAAADDLARLKTLSELYIRWTRITHSGADQIEKRLPNCAVYFHVSDDGRIAARR
jgi:Leucine Rich repeat